MRTAARQAHGAQEVLYRPLAVAVLHAEFAFENLA